MRDSIQLDQYVLQPLAKGSNSQISILTLDPDSPNFKILKAQDSLFDDSLDDLKNEMDFFSIDGNNFQKNVSNYNCSSTINSTTPKSTNLTANSNQHQKIFSKLSAMNNNHFYNYNNQNQNQSPLILLNSKSETYSPGTNMLQDSNNLLNSPLIQFNFVNTSLNQQHNNNQFFLPPSQLNDKNIYKQKQEDFDKNNSLKNNQFKNNFIQSYPLSNNHHHLPQFQKSISEAISSSHQPYKQQMYSQQQQNIYLTQQKMFFQGEDSYTSLPSPPPQLMNQCVTQHLISPPHNSQSFFHQNSLNYQSNLQNEKQIQNNNEKFHQDIYNEQVYNNPSYNQEQIQQQNQQFISNINQQQQEIQTNKVSSNQNQQFLQYSHQIQQQNQLQFIFQQQQQQQQQYQIMQNTIQKQSKQQQQNDNLIQENSNINSNDQLYLNIAIPNTSISNNFPNQETKNTFSPFSYPVNCFISQFENQDNSQLITSPILFQHKSQQPESGKQEFNLMRQRGVSYQDQTQKQQHQKKTKYSKKKQNKKLLQDKGQQSQKQMKEFKTCLEKHCPSVGYQQYQPTSPIFNNNIHQTLIIKQIIHHEQSIHDQNCFNLYNEYTIQSNLNHPNILKPIQLQLIKDSQNHPKAKGGCYIIYPKAQSDMYDYCLTPINRNIDIEEIRIMMKQVSSALLYIHEKNIVHCDIKPENIFKLSNNNFVLADFGLARYIIQDQNDIIIQSQNSSLNITPSNSITQDQTKNQNLNNKNILNKQINKSILSDQNEDTYLSIISDTQQNRSLGNIKPTNNTKTMVNNITKSSTNNQIDINEAQTGDSSSNEQIQQTLDSQTSSSTNLSSSNDNNPSDFRKIKSCFHCYPQNLPEYVYANINIPYQSYKNQKESDATTFDVCENSCECYSIQDDYVENLVEDDNDDLQICNENIDEKFNDESNQEVNQQEIGSCNDEDNLQVMNLCDQFTFKTRQSDYFSPEIVKYQTLIQNGDINKSNLNLFEQENIDDKKADIFALGMSLFVCLFKNYPYQDKCSINDSLYRYMGSTDKKVREKFWQNFVPSLEHYANQFDDSRVHELQDLLEKMLHPDPSERISAKEVVQHQWLGISEQSRK